MLSQIIIFLKVFFILDPDEARCLVAPGPAVIKLFFMWNSAQYKIYPAHKC